MKLLFALATALALLGGCTSADQECASRCLSGYKLVPRPALCLAGKVVFSCVHYECVCVGPPSRPECGQ